MDAPVAEALDGDDLAARILDGQRETRQDPLAVDEHRAGTAGALVAALLRPGEAEMLSEGIEQRHARVELDGTIDAVHVKFDAIGHDEIPFLVHTRLFERTSGISSRSPSPGERGKLTSYFRGAIWLGGVIYLAL